MAEENNTIVQQDKKDVPVFISYASEDENVAAVVVDYLERHGLNCWFAKRSISGGASYPEEIEEAIRSSRIMILLVSPQCNGSVHTRKEVILGVDHGLALLPVRISQYSAWGFVKYFLADCQWIDIVQESIDTHLELILETVRCLLSSPWKRDISGKISSGPLPSGVKPGKLLGITPLGAYLPLSRQPKPADPKSEQPKTGNPKREQPSVWLQAHRGFIGLYHRETEMESLKDFINEPGGFRWSVIIGEGGVGKTRLALEFAKAALSEGWHSGMLYGHGLDLFTRSVAFPDWRPAVPTLIIIDYAASKVNMLRVLLQQLASLEIEYVDGVDRPNSGPAIRLLLLERHGDEDKGWLKELLSCGEGQVNDLLQNSCYKGIRELLPPSSKHAVEKDDSFADAARSIIEATFSSWSAAQGRAKPVLRDFSSDDWRRIQVNTGGRPLYLQMAAIHASESGSVDHLPLWGRGVLLQAAVQRELKYVEKECEDNGDLRMAVNHIAAILCIAGMGLSKSRKWLSIVKEENSVVGVDNLSPNQVEKRRKTIFLEPACNDSDEDPVNNDTDGEPANNDSDGETGLIQPDIVSEGFAATVLLGEERELGIQPADTLRQIILLAGMKGWSNLVRMVQDLDGITGYEPVKKWAMKLVRDQNPEILLGISDIMPERTASLHDLGILVNECLAKEMAGRTDEERSRYLLKLGTHRHRGRTHNKKDLEQARSELEEAIRLLESLVRKNHSEGTTALLSKSHRENAWVLEDIYSLTNEKDLWSQAGLHQVLGVMAAAGIYPDEPSAIDCTEATVVDILSKAPPESTPLASEYANCLNNLSNTFDANGFINISKDIAQRACEMGEQLVKVSRTLFAPDLARYLNNLSKRQNSLGMTEEAIANITRSIHIREEFVGRRFDEFAEPLTLSLDTLMTMQYNKKDFAGAQRTTEQIISIYRDLALRNPLKFRSKLANEYNSLGNIIYRNNQVDIGIDFMLKCISIREELVNEDFEAHCLDLANSHMNAAIFYRALGKDDLAYPHAEKAYELNKELMERNKGSYSQGIIKSADLLASLCKRTGRNDDASKWKKIAEDMKIRGQYKDYILGNQIQKDFKVNNEGIIRSRNFGIKVIKDKGLMEHARAEALNSEGRREEAVQAAETARGFFQEVAAKSTPGSDKVEFAEACCNLSSALALLGDWKTDPALLRESEGMARKALLEITPETPGSVFTWGAVKHNLGHALFRLGEIESDNQLLSDGITNLEQALEHQRNHEYADAAEQTKNMLDRAREAQMNFKLTRE